MVSPIPGNGKGNSAASPLKLSGLILSRRGYISICIALYLGERSAWSEVIIYIRSSVVVRSPSIAISPTLHANPKVREGNRFKNAPSQCHLVLTGMVAEKVSFFHRFEKVRGTVYRDRLK